MSAAGSITLGGRTFPVHAFNLGELEELAGALDAMASESGRSRFAALRAIITVVIRREDPAFTPEAALKMEATAAELRAAVDTIMAVSGFVPAKATPAIPGQPPGEAGAEAASTST